jgi:hypothetical protein
MTRCLSIVLLHIGLLSAQISTPKKFFGFQPGADRKIARWDRIVDYYNLLQKEAPDRIRVVNMGPTTMGNPFLVVTITSAGNLSRLDRLRQVNAAISDPRGRTEQEIRKLVSEGRAVVLQSMSLHASEIGGTQMAPELAYDLLARNDEETRRILDNVVFLMVPSFNPDGQIMVHDWYQKTLGTEYEGADLPWLYHKYVGHDNNRDAFQTNMVESRYMAKLLFRDWIPQAYVDHHHMGPYGARIYLPPYAEPIRPGADPLVWREMSWYGGHMAYKEEEENKSGVLNMAEYSGWGHFGFHWITPFHNIAGMLTESASARLASPMFIHPDQLRGGVRNLPLYEAQTVFPNPWPGGWWHLRDIVERQKVAAWAVLDLAARNRETVLWNAYLKAKRQTERGAQGKPAAYVVPATQHDPITAATMVNKLLIQGIEVERLTRTFTTAEGMTYPAGSYVVPMAQPKMGVVRYLLGRTSYPDNEWTRGRDGSPTYPYDMATDTMFEFMGVRVDPVDEPVQAAVEKVSGEVPLAGKVAGGASAWKFDARLNSSFKVMNALFDKGVEVRRVDRTGDFVVGSNAQPLLAGLAEDTGVNFDASGAGVLSASRRVQRLRIGMYQRYRGGNIDEGWTRWLLEQYGFPYKSVMDAEIKKGDLNANYDLFILPEDSTAAITGDRAGDRDRGRRDESIPPEYRSGIGEDGVKALKAFVEKGGTLVTLGDASNFAIDKLGVNVRNIVAKLPSKQFWCPGSTLRVSVDNSNALAYGMPAKALAVYMSGNPVFELSPVEHNEDYEVIVRYADRDLLESGWLVGEDAIAKKAAMVSAKLGAGRVVLIGFRPQHRAQTAGTFKLLFNALVR